MVIDPISDMLTRIRNAVTKKHKNVLVPSSKFKVEIAKILQNEGFINSFQIIKNGTFPSIKIDLKYDSRKSPVIKKIKTLTNKPIIAIGGINNKNYKKLLLNNVNFLAISGYIFNNKKYKPVEAIKKLI